MLEYNPGFRPSAKELIQHPYFDAIRNKNQEEEAPTHVHQKMHLPGVLDYEQKMDHNRIKDYRKMLMEEINYLKKPLVIETGDLLTPKRRNRKDTLATSVKNSL